MTACHPVLLAGHVSQARTGHSPAVCVGGGHGQEVTRNRFLLAPVELSVWAPVSSLDRNWRMAFSDSLLHLQTLRERDEQGWKCGGRPGQTEAVSALAGRGAQGCRTGSSPLEGLPAPAEKIPSLHGLLVSAWGPLGYHVTSLVASSVKCRSWTSPHQAQKLQDSLAKAMM